MTAHFIFRTLPLAALLLTAGCKRSGKGDPVAEADKFFALVRQGHAAEAYNSAAFGFQAQQSLPNFQATMHDLGVANFLSCNWTRVVRRDEKNEVKLDGEIATRDGSKLKFEATLARDRGRWRMFALRTHGAEALPTENPFTLVGRGAAFQDVANRPVPPVDDVRVLVRATILDFNEAIQKKSFDDFFNRISLSWQKQVSPKRLMRAFEPFVENKINLTEFGIQQSAPQFSSPPTVNGEGLLVVNGIFPTNPYRVAFSFRYMYEVPHWKLFGIDVNLVAPQ